MNKLSLLDYHKMLMQHDWYYMMSEDKKVYRAGQMRESQLEQIARSDKKYRKLYDEFYKHKYWQGHPAKRPDMPSAPKKGD